MNLATCNHAHVFRRVAFAWLLLLCLALRAQQEHDPELLLQMSLEELMNVEVVSASRYKQNIENAPASVIVVTEQQIRERGYEDLVDVLRDLPGFDVIENAGRFGEFYTIRGIEGNDRFLVLIDGQKLNPASGTFLSVGNSISILQARQVEVIYGSASAIYGADAFAGIINIITRQPDENGYIVRGSLGSQNTGNVFGEAHFALPGLAGARIDLAGRVYQSDGPGLEEDDPGGRFIRMYPPPLTPELEQPVNDHNLSARFRYGNLTLSYFRQYFSEGNALGLDPSAYVYNKENRWIVATDVSSVNYEHDFRRRGLLSVAGTYTRHVQDPQTQFLKIMRTDSQNTILQQYMTGKDNSLKGSLIYRNGFAGKLNLITGLDVERISSIPPYANDFLFPGQPIKYEGPAAATIDDSLTIIEKRFAAFGQATYTPLPWLDLIGGLRFDYSSRYSNTANPRIAAVLKPAKDTRIKLFYGTAFQAPSLFFQFEQFGAPAIVMVPNPDLDNQRLRTFSVTVSRKLRSSVHVKASYYYNDLKDLIVRKLLPDTLFFNPYFNRYTPGIQNVNVGKQIASGFDLELTASVSRIISGYLYYSYTDAHIKTDRENIHLPRVADHKLKIGATYRGIPGVIFSPRLRRIGNLNTAQSNTLYRGGSQPGYTQVDLYLALQKVIPHTNLFIYIENLLDNDIEHAGLFEQGAPHTPYLPVIRQPGLTIRIGSEVRL